MALIIAYVMAIYAVWPILFVASFLSGLTWGSDSA